MSCTTVVKTFCERAEKLRTSDKSKEDSKDGTYSSRRQHDSKAEDIGHIIRHAASNSRAISRVCFPLTTFTLRHFTGVLALKTCKTPVKRLSCHSTVKAQVLSHWGGAFAGH